MNAHLYYLERHPGNDLETFEPQDPENVEELIVAHIGLEGRPGRDLFYFKLATPKGLGRALWEQRFIWEANLLIVERYDWKLVSSLVRQLVARAEGDTWEDIARRLNPYAHWEGDYTTPIQLD